jgi:hypothetical protein
MYIVEGRPSEGFGSIMVVKTSRADALATAIDFQDQGMPYIAISGDDRTYTADEFKQTIGEPDAPRP